MAYYSTNLDGYLNSTETIDINCQIISTRESDCEVVSFENIPLDAKGITKSASDCEVALKDRAIASKILRFWHDSFCPCTARTSKHRPKEFGDIYLYEPAGCHKLKISKPASQANLRLT